MQRKRFSSPAAIGLVFPWLVLVVAVPQGRAQNPQAQQQIEELKQSFAANKQALSQFTWQEQQTVLIKGNVKKQEFFQVRMGPDGKPQKMPLEPQAAPQEEHGIRGHIKEKKIEEFEDYAHQIAALAQGYAQPEPGRIQQLYQQGAVMLGSGGAPNFLRVVIQGYQKPGDSVTLVFDRAQKSIQGLEISSYLSDPSDAVKISAQYAPLPGGPNHVSQMVVNGISKQLTVQIQNSNYQRL